MIAIRIQNHGELIDRAAGIPGLGAAVVRLPLVEARRVVEAFAAKELRPELAKKGVRADVSVTEDTGGAFIPKILLLAMGAGVGVLICLLLGGE